MKKYLSLLLIVFGLMLSGAGIWEVYSSTQASSAADLSSSLSGEKREDQTTESQAEKNITEQQVEATNSEEELEEESPRTEKSQKEKSEVRQAEGDSSRGGTGSGEPSVPSPVAKKPATQLTVTLSITGDQGAPILAATRVAIKQGDTVYDVLLRATQQHGIQMEKRGTGALLYVEGINNLYEFDRGPESGWMYRVNGVFPNKSAGVYDVKSGDRIEWLYTRDLGRDVGATFP